MPWQSSPEAVWPRCHHLEPGRGTGHRLRRSPTGPETIPDRPEPTPRVAVVWDAKLAFAARIDADGDLGVGERDLFVAVNDWLRDVPDPIVVPVRERSWEILRDEKALERARRGRLFGPGRLTDHLLAIEPVFAPVETTRHGPSPERVVLVVDNWMTYRTLGWVAQRSGWSGTVLWGAGNQVTSRVEAAADVIDQPQQVRYFGDVDVVGLRLARDVTATCETVGWPAPAPAVGLYRLLVDAGSPIHASGRTPRVPAWMRSGWPTGSRTRRSQPRLSMRLRGAGSRRRPWAESRSRTGFFATSSVASSTL